MLNPIRNKGINLLDDNPVLYIWKDGFIQDVPAGQVNNSLVFPGYKDQSLTPLRRTAVDTYTTTNMVLNPGFETAGGGDPDFFGSWTETAGSGAIADETTLVHGGSHAAKLTAGADTTNCRISQLITVIPGYTYTLSFWTRGDGTYAGTYSVYNSTASSNIIAPTTTGITGTDYTQFSVNFTAPAGCVQVSISVRASATNTGIAYFDDVSLLPTVGLLSVSGGKLVVAGGKSVSSYGDPGVWYPAVARAAGVALYSKIIIVGGSGDTLIGFDTNTTVTPDAVSIYFNNKTLKVWDSNGSAESTVGVYVEGTEYKVLSILRAAGAFHYIRTGGAWVLLYPGIANTTASIYPCISGRTNIFTIDDLRLLSLPAPFNTDYGIATQRLAGARSVDDAFSHEANCILEYTVTTLGSDSAIRLNFRQQDTTNFWRIYVGTDGSIILYEFVDNTGTSRTSSAAGSIANGQRIVVIADGSTIKVYANNVLKFTYTSATNFATSTSGLLATLGTGGAVSDIVSYPRYPSGTALQVIESRTR